MEAGLAKIVAADDDNLDEFIGRIEAAVSAHVEAQLKEANRKLDIVLTFIASLDELKEQLGPIIEGLESSPLFKMLGKMG